MADKKIFMQVSSQSYKICSACQTVNRLDTVQCAHCGYPYPDQTSHSLSAFEPPALEADPQGLPITAVATSLLIAGFLLGIITVTRVASDPFHFPRASSAQSALVYDSALLTPVTPDGADVQPVSAVMEGEVWMSAPARTPKSLSPFSAQAPGGLTSTQQSLETDCFGNTLIVAPYTQNKLTLPTRNVLLRLQKTARPHSPDMKGAAR